MSLEQCPSDWLHVEPTISTDGGVDIAMLMTRAADMSGVPVRTTNTVLSHLSSPCCLDLKSSTSTAFRLWHLLNTLAQDSVMLKAFCCRMHRGMHLASAPYSIYNIQMLAQFATKLLSVEMSRVQAAHEKKDSQLSRNLGNAEQLCAEIASLSHTLKLTMSGEDAFRDQLKDYQDRLALLDRVRDDVELLIEQYRSEHISVRTSLAILRISRVEQIYVPVTRVAKYVPELILSTVVA